MTKTIKFDIDKDGIATLTVDLPGRSMNVVDANFLDDMDTLLAQIRTNDSIKGAIITSGKDAFMAGADLRMLAEMSETAKSADAATLFAAAHRFTQLLRDLETCGKPVVTAVNGLALGGGLPTTQKSNSASPRSWSAFYLARAACSACCEWLGFNRRYSFAPRVKTLAPWRGLEWACSIRPHPWATS